MQGLLQLLRLIESVSTVSGRKKLQKIVHILQARGYDFPQHFGFLHYGPFSSAVAAEIDALVAGSLVREQGDGQPMVAYVYEATESARQLLSNLSLTEVPKWKSLALDLNKRSATDLEAISTILYLQANGFEGEQLKTRFGELKPGLAGLYASALKTCKKLPTA